MILSVDQGTTGTRGILFDDEGRPAGSAYREHRQFHPRAGWVEHDPEEIFQAVTATAAEAAGDARVSAIGLANQGETVMAWDAATSTPAYPAIVWQDGRTAGHMDALKARHGLEERVRHRTGLVLDAYFSASKIEWLLENVGACRDLARAGRLRVGTLDTWILWRWTRGEVFATDPTTASRTLLMNLREQDWDSQMLALFRIDRAWLPEIRPTAGPFGFVRLGGREAPVMASAVDQQAALYGQCCFRAGEAKCTYGTGAFLLTHTGSQPIESKHGLLTTVACAPAGRAYALDGGVYVAGAAVQWARDQLSLIADASEAAALAASVADSGGVTFLPSLAGLSAPWWSRSAKGLLHGLSGSTTRAHLLRAMFEGIAYQVHAVAQAMAKDSGHALAGPLRVDGGLTRNEFLMQFQADLLGAPVEAPECDESTAIGVAFLAGLPPRRQVRRVWEPRMSADQREGHLERHRRAVRQLLEWNS